MMTMNEKMVNDEMLVNVTGGTYEESIKDVDFFCNHNLMVKTAVPTFDTYFKKAKALYADYGVLVSSYYNGYNVYYIPGVDSRVTQAEAQAYVESKLN